MFFFNQAAVLVTSAFALLDSLPILATPQLSLVADGAPRATLLALHLPPSAVTVSAVGELIDGFSAYGMVTFCVQDFLFPRMSGYRPDTGMLPAQAGLLAALAAPANP